jgi:TfoX/Sxy family transcriptional regulator of competence genes
MPYDEFFADRIRKAFRDQHVDAEEKKMMGGVCYLVNGKMCAGIVKNKLMARIDPEDHEKALAVKGCTEMDFTGKPMKGFVFVGPEGTDTDADLDYWIKLCLEYNPKAKSSKRK